MNSINFDNIEYLQAGNQKQRKAFTTLKNHAVMDKLAAFDPLLAGTVPIAIDIDESDLDVICCWSDEKSFIDSIIENFSDARAFSMTRKIIHHNLTIIASLTLDSFQVEIFGQNRPTKEQEAYRHMVVEYNILSARGEEFRQEIIRLKKAGMKTEVAFGKLLGIAGDPYHELLHYRGL